MAKKLIIDGTEIEVEDGLTLIQACEQAGVEIPRFCYHERLSIAGNCRMCLVEVVGMPKPQASCAIGVNDLPPNKDGSPKVINTRSPVVKKAREGVMEFLLINHPLDCPICDQGGECDLQDQAMAFGVGGSRYTENKRAVEEKNLGPLIKTIMTRCIQCTRCVRFMTEVAGVEELGAIGRGEDMEITTYLEKGMMSELSANVVDLCPVGALTHRPWAFGARPWEMTKTESIDVTDALGSNITVYTRGREVMRILPRNNDAVNEEWISDKARHIVDGLKAQRLDQPYVRRDGRLQSASWDEALRLVAARLAGAGRVTGVAGDLAGAEEMFALQALLAQHANGRTFLESAFSLDPALGRASYVFNATIEGIERASSALLIGTNPRIEAAVLNARLRKRFLRGGFTVGVVGANSDLSFPSHHLGTTTEVLSALSEPSNAFHQIMKAGAAPLIIVGRGAWGRGDGRAILAAAARLATAVGAIKNDWNGFSVLHTDASTVAGLDLGLTALDASALSAHVVYLLGADAARVPAGPFVVYQGSHGDAGANRADVILPGAAPTEKSATYVNTEGRAQMTARAAFPPGEAKEDWTILRALSAYTNSALPFDNVAALRAAMYKSAPALARLGAVQAADATALARLAETTGALGREPFTPVIADFYLTNVIARASRVLAELSQMKRAARTPARQAAE
jgi:NADH-quinone oxidoreductase subunit G